jgi:hypothetical protein
MRQRLSAYSEKSDWQVGVCTATTVAIFAEVTMFPVPWLYQPPDGIKDTCVSIPRSFWLHLHRTRSVLCCRLSVEFCTRQQGVPHLRLSFARFYVSHVVVMKTGEQWREFCNRAVGPTREPLGLQGRLNLKKNYFWLSGTEFVLFFSHRIH